MSELSKEQIEKRLRALGDGLAQFPAGLACPWPVAKVFNELLKQARRIVADDPILQGIRFIEESSADHDMGGSNALIGTVQMLVGQVLVVLESEPGPVPRRRSSGGRPAGVAGKG